MRWAGDAKYGGRTVHVGDDDSYLALYTHAVLRSAIFVFVSVFCSSATPSSVTPVRVTFRSSSEVSGFRLGNPASVIAVDAISNSTPS